MLAECHLPNVGFYGDDTRDVREQTIKQFRECTGFMCMVLTTRAGGLGINLGTCAIFSSGLN